MLHIDPIEEEKARPKVQETFSAIKTALNLPRVPIFFRYLANFEDYLCFIWEKIDKNLSDKSFSTLTDEVSDFYYKNLEVIYQPDEETASKIKGILVLPADQYAVKKDIEKSIRINTELVLTFLSLREAVKGWAVGVRLISQEHFKYGTKAEESVIDELIDIPAGEDSFSLARAHDELIETPGLTVSAYSKFLEVMFEETYFLRKQKEYVYKRVEIERYLLGQIHQIPHSIQSSYSMVASLAAKDPYFNELLYLLSDSFPTLAVFRLTSSVVGKIMLSRL